jgi:hypothetical protein
MYIDALSTALAALSLFAFYLYHRQRQQELASRQNGCGIVHKLQPKEPLTGIDFMMSAHIDIPRLRADHQAHGSTIQLRKLLGAPAIFSIAADNVKTVCGGKEWGVECMRLPWWNDFCGFGLLSTDGEVWNHSRKIWKPAFAKENLIGMEFFAAQIDTLVERIPKDGTTVDLQPLLYAAVCRDYQRMSTHR